MVCSVTRTPPPSKQNLTQMFDAIVLETPSQGAVLLRCANACSALQNHSHMQMAGVAAAAHGGGVATIKGRDKSRHGGESCRATDSAKS